ncbi:hypothetical protein BJV74DRAFT_862105 [Russula compacta]|nr:hypothetical protein BJV74DRAFT_862105 [Russula compacta]
MDMDTSLRLMLGPRYSLTGSITCAQLASFFRVKGHSKRSCHALTHAERVISLKISSNYQLGALSTSQLDS